MDFYLKFSDEQAARAVLFELEGEEITERPVYRNTDIIGTLYDFPEMAEPVALEGWHVNVRLDPDEDGTALLPFAVTPTNPRRVWA